MLRIVLHLPGYHHWPYDWEGDIDSFLNMARAQTPRDQYSVIKVWRNDVVEVNVTKRKGG